MVMKFDRDMCVFMITASIDSLPSVSCIKFKDHLNMAVGTSTGQVNTITFIALPSSSGVTRVGVTRGGN